MHKLVVVPHAGVLALVLAPIVAGVHTPGWLAEVGVGLAVLQQVVVVFEGKARSLRCAILQLVDHETADD